MAIINVEHKHMLVFTDVAMQNQLLSTLEARQQDIFQKMKLDIEKHAAALALSSFKYISEAEEAFRRETCKVVDTYHIPRSDKGCSFFLSILSHCFS